MQISLKRAYEGPSPEDGRRLLVERLWPRGITKERAQLAAWLKEVSPSPELRKWFAHDPAKWEEFQARYLAELQERPEAVAVLREHLEGGPVTFVYAAKDPERNSALLLKRFLERGEI